MKRNFKIFLRTVVVTSTIIFCLSFGIIGTIKAYEGTRLIGYGEYRPAIQFSKDGFKFFDFEVKF